MDEPDRPIVPAPVERIEIGESAGTFLYIATFPF